MITKEITKNKDGVDIYESKWGCHPCSRETYMKLRKLNYWLLQAKKSAAAYTRWFRKKEHNRVIRKRIRNEKGQVIGYEIVGTRPQPKVPEPFCSFKSHRCWGYMDRTKKTRWETTDRLAYLFDESNIRVDTLGIEADYRNAKRPRAKKDVYSLINSPEEIDRLYKLVIDCKMKNK